MAGVTPAAQDAGPDEFAAVFAAFSSALEAGQLPPQALAAARTNLFDTLACAIAGTSAPGVGEVRDLVTGWGGAAEAAIWGAGIRVPAHHAAWVNGMMAHARDYDDTHDAAVLHAGVSVVPAALAAAELSGDATGADVLAGVAAGLELVSRLGVATTIGIIESGFIYTSLFGYFGATAAAARVLRLNASETVNALGVAYSQAAGTHQVTRDAALTKRMQPGFAAKAALLSVQLTKRGIRGAQNTFEGADGLFRTYLRGRYDGDALREGLGERFEFVNLSYKPYPCCRFDHTAIDAALAIRARPEFDIARVAHAQVRVNRQAFEAVCTPTQMRRKPETVVQAQFSIPYTVACALIDGRVGLGHFTAEGLRRVDVLALASRIEGVVDDEIERDWSRSISPSHIRLALQSGEVLESRVDYPRGHGSNPMTQSDFDAKLADCIGFSAATLAPDTATRLRATLDALERDNSAGSLLALLQPAARASA
jgi:2-methylcitrate dehydratase PrpD